MRRLKVFQLGFNVDFNNLLSNNRIYSLSKYNNKGQWGYPNFNQSGLQVHEANTLKTRWLVDGNFIILKV